MPATRTVVLYGNSVGLRSIGAFLKEHAEVRLLQLDANQPDDADRLRTLDAYVLLFDLATAPPHVMACFFEIHPPLALIGVDLTAGTLLVLTGRSANGKTVDDVLEAIMN